MRSHKTMFGALKSPGSDVRDEDSRRKEEFAAKVAKFVGEAAEEARNKKKADKR